MTNEEAIVQLNRVAQVANQNTIDAVEMAIEALEQQPCEDAVSRQAVIEITAETGALETQSRVRELPSVTPKEKTGHWIMENMFDGDVAYRCSECNELFWIESGTPKDNEYNFCPNCGARMVIE